MNPKDEEKVKQIIVSLAALGISCTLNDDLKEEFYEHPIDFLRKTGMKFPEEKKQLDKIKVFIDPKIFRWFKAIIKCKDSSDRCNYKYLLIDEGVLITRHDWEYFSKGKYDDLKKSLEYKYPQTEEFTSIKDVIDRLKYFYPGALDGEEGKKLITEMNEWDKSIENGIFIIMPFLDPDFFPLPDQITEDT